MPLMRVFFVLFFVFFVFFFGGGGLGGMAERGRGWSGMKAVNMDGIENVLKNYSEVWKRMCTGSTALDANGIHSPQLFITNTKS